MPSECCSGTIEVACVETPFGGLRLTVCEGELTGIDVLTGNVEVSVPSGAVMVHAVEQLNRYFADPGHPLALPLRAVGTEYQNRVWNALRALSPGQTETYTGLASRLSSGPRAIASACKANPYPIVVPCHRVLALHGQGGYCGAQKGPFMAVKTWLLQHEGVRPG